MEIQSFYRIFKRTLLFIEAWKLVSFSLLTFSLKFLRIINKNYDAVNYFIFLTIMRRKGIIQQGNAMKWQNKPTLKLQLLHNLFV